MYGIDLSVQFENLMPALGIGFILAFVYDIVVFVRNTLFGGKGAVFVTDTLYVLFCTVASYILFVAVNSGHIRSYLILAEILAAVIYRFTAGTLVTAVLKRFSDVITKIKHMIFSPFEVAFKKFKEKTLQCAEKIIKIFKKNKINSENPLKDSNAL